MTAVRCSGTCPSPNMARPIEWGTKFEAVGEERNQKEKKCVQNFELKTLTGNTTWKTYVCTRRKYYNGF